MFLDCCYPTPAQLGHQSTFVRIFHKSKCYGIILFLPYNNNPVFAGAMILAIAVFIFFTINSVEG